MRGGSIEAVERVIRDTPVRPEDVHIIKPESNFVVVTYWWGKVNRNLQLPCPEDIREKVIPVIMKRLSDRGRKFPNSIITSVKYIKAISNTRPLTEYERELSQSFRRAWDLWVKEVLTDPDLKLEIAAIQDKIEEEEFKKPGTRKPRTFKEMIVEWDDKCQKAGVNYVALQTEFEREDYQHGINGKPLFIQKMLDAVAPRAVLYIDGDMWMHKYPDIFDIQNVDFMARGWNTDCRTKKKAIENPFYDPYTFETSGGTMYFGNTQTARDLLNAWSRESALPKNDKKADDRILSQVFTTQSLVLGTNIINLPIEYLWLTDNYKEHLSDPAGPATLEDAYIEHPYCLTGEERAAEQGAASNRMPDGYEEEVTENINYKRPTETLYEFIYFDENQKMRDCFDKYLKYMKTAKNGFTKELLMNIIDFADKYGPYNDIATKNLAGLTASPPPATPTRVTLPFNAPIPDILKVLFAGNDVELGGSVKDVRPEDEVVGYTNSTTPVDMYTRTVKIDISEPMFISGKCKIIRHALAMCETLADINKHIEGSYMFMSRIRWNLLKIPGAKKVSPIKMLGKELGFTHTVHQIWFGGDLPEWRKYMFDANKTICEEHGFKYSLWRNADRNEDNFPITLKYQETALAKGKETGQNRWAQVADLARLEIIYNVGGIYIDSLIEITPAFLMAVIEAIEEGATFVGCNEDPCDPPADCVGNAGRKYLTNSFFAATKANPIFKRLLTFEKLDAIDFDSEYINRTTGPYFLREGIEDVVADKVFMFETEQMYPFNQQKTEYRESTPNIFLSKVRVPGSIVVKPGMFYVPGGAETMQTEFVVDQKGPLAIYHSGLGGTWST